MLGRPSWTGLSHVEAILELSGEHLGSFLGHLDAISILETIWNHLEAILKRSKSQLGDPMPPKRGLDPGRAPVPPPCTLPLIKSCRYFYDGPHAQGALSVIPYRLVFGCVFSLTNARICMFVVIFLHRDKSYHLYGGI